MILHKTLGYILNLVSHEIFCLIFVHVLVETPVRSFLFDPSGLVVLWKRWLAKQVLPSYQTLMGPPHLLRLQFSFSDIADHNVAIQLPNRCLAQSFVNSECLSLRRRRLLVHYLLSVTVLLVLFNCLAILLSYIFDIWYIRHQYWSTVYMV